MGSASVLSNSDGSVIEWEADYYPFGTKRVITNNVDNSYLFTGYEFDYETGYNYAGFREQSPALGRFFSPDPLGGDINPQSLNRYTYVMNNPVNFTDPLGLETCYNVVKTGTEEQPIFTFVEVPCANASSSLDLLRAAGCQMSPFGRTGSCFGGRKIGDEVGEGPHAHVRRPDVSTSAVNETIQRAATCAKAYYGIGTLGSRAAIAAAGAPVPKALVGMGRAFAGSSIFTTIPSRLSLGMGTIAAGNWLRSAGCLAVPVFWATVAIDATAIGVCTIIDQ